MSNKEQECEKRLPSKLPLLISKPTAPPPSLPPTILGKPNQPPPQAPDLKPPGVERNPKKLTDDAKNFESEDASPKSSDDINTSKSSSIKMKPVKITPFKALLSTSATKTQAKKRDKASLADIFNEDSQSDDEDMPPEAKMRMRNIGKDTPVPSGPNSFNKGKLGFCNSARIFEKSLEAAGEEKGDVLKTNTKTVPKGNWNNNFKKID